MSLEDQKDEVKEEVKEEVKQEVKQEVRENPFESRAREMGWRPEEEWDGEPEDWVDAREFIGRQKLYDRISQAEKRAKEASRTLNDFKNHYEKVQKTEYERALATLKDQKKAALLEGDADQVIEIDDKIDQVKEDIRRAETTSAKESPEVQEYRQMFTSWLGQNTWYQTSPEMKKTADLLGANFAALNPDKHPGDVLKYISREIKQRFPKMFKNENQERPSSVEDGDSKPKKRDTSNSFDESSLNDDERRVMQRLVSQKVITKEKYLEDLKKVKERSNG